MDVLRAAGYLFENHIGSRLFYKIEDEAGLTLAGDAELPSPVALSQEVQFFSLVSFEDALLRGQPVRLTSLRHVLVDSPGTPGRSAHTPRTIRSIFKPAWLAWYRASMPGAW